jgi:Family of unknown function (DUF6131)
MKLVKLTATGPRVRGAAAAAHAGNPTTAHRPRERVPTGAVELTRQRGTSKVRSARSLGVAQGVEAGGGSSVLILGLVLLIIGFVTKIAILWTIGIILLIVGAVLWILGSMGRPVGGRRHYW